MATAIPCRWQGFGAFAVSPPFGAIGGGGKLSVGWAVEETEAALCAARGSHHMKPEGTTKPSGRAAALTAERNRKMAASAHAYVRGSTVRFYAWLEGSDRRGLPEGPPVWICGDCHVGNLGPVASTDGKLAIQIRDLDQTVIGNPAHDLIRLGLSLAMAARGSDLPGVTTARMLECMVEGYEAAFAPEAHGETLDAEASMPKTVRRIMRTAAGRSWKHLADERIEGVEPVIPVGKRFWPLTAEERRAADGLFAEEALRRLATSLRSREEGAPVRVLDAAYWRKGCSSLGRLRMAVLLAVGNGRAERHCLMDVKEAITAAAPRSAKGEMPRDNAERVVTGARKLSPFLGSRMVAARVLGKAVFVRELLPQDLKIELENLSVGEARDVAEFLARVVGRGHARQMHEEERAAWLKDLGKHRSGDLDAPSWLWNLQPAPAAVEAGEHPNGPAQAAGQMHHGGVDADQQVDRLQPRRRVGEILYALHHVEDRAIAGLDLLPRVAKLETHHPHARHIPQRGKQIQAGGAAAVHQVRAQLVPPRVARPDQPDHEITVASAVPDRRTCPRRRMAGNVQVGRSRDRLQP